MSVFLATQGFQEILLHAGLPQTPQLYVGVCPCQRLMANHEAQQVTITLCPVTCSRLSTKSQKCSAHPWFGRVLFLFLFLFLFFFFVVSRSRPGSVLVLVGHCQALHNQHGSPVVLFVSVAAVIATVITVSPDVSSVVVTATIAFSAAPVVKSISVAVCARVVLPVAYAPIAVINATIITTPPIIPAIVVPTTVVTTVVPLWATAHPACRWMVTLYAGGGLCRPQARGQPAPFAPCAPPCSSQGQCDLRYVRFAPCGEEKCLCGPA